MASDEFFTLVRSWLTVHLPRARRLSPHTIRSYKTAINTLLAYLAETRQVKLAEVSFEAIDHATITGFTTWLLDTRQPKPVLGEPTPGRDQIVPVLLRGRGPGTGRNLAGRQTDPARPHPYPAARRADHDRRRRADPSTRPRTAAGTSGTPP